MDPAKVRFLQDVREQIIDPTIDSPIYRAFVDQLPFVNHYIRYCNTIRSMVAFGLPYEDSYICETGSFSAVSDFWNKAGYQVTKTETDLRYPLKLPDDNFDLLLSLEVIEHLKDQSEKCFDDIVEFKGTGAKTYATELTRILKPGGHLVLTTPNPCSLFVLKEILEQNAPCLFRPHVREYTRKELESLFDGLELVCYETHNSFYYLGGRFDPRLIRIFELGGWDAANRGDDQFMIFRKSCG